ncbi:recombinase family protein [Microbacterium sp. CnD16-F]|nr:recombinase family protein [Microbacterium sp. CnD16-F]MCO7204250.1 recombinase family protein [Microbacterium sp. CnD16-F]
MIDPSADDGALARTLNAEGVRTATGKTWYASTVRATVTSETARALEIA